MTPTVILCDEQGAALGEMDTLQAHTGGGSLHRAFSIYVFRKHRSEILIQKRSREKMLWPLIWANTCCSHPLQSETPRESGERRLKEEMGFTCPLHEAMAFVYRADDPSGRGTEHEYVRILTGDIAEDITPLPDPAEVADWEWLPLDTLQKRMHDEPDSFAPWFHEGLRLLLEQR